MRKINFFKPQSLIFFLVCFAFVFTACHTSQKREYYAKKSNYVEVSGIVVGISYNEELSALYLEFSELPQKFDDVCFKIVGENLSIVQKKRINNKISVGEKVSFVTAPKYFGDGYVFPIVAITVDDEELLCFDDGFVNWLKWMS